MILVGQYDSPFVRRVAIAMDLYGIGFEHRPWSVFGDAGRIRPLNPLTRVPVLVLDDGETLIETSAILDHLDHLAGPGRALIAADGAARRACLKVMALASGLSDKAVSLFYVRVLHDLPSPLLVERSTAQMLDTLACLEAGAPEAGFWFGAGPSHADIAVTATLTHAMAAHPDILRLDGFGRLAALQARCEALPVFNRIYQPFVAPA